MKDEHTKKKIYLKDKKAITLLSMSITIIVMIIFGAVLINATIGNNGLCTLAKKTKNDMDDTMISKEQELRDLYSKLQVSADGTITVNADTLQEIIDNRIATQTASMANRITELETAKSTLESQVSTLQSSNSTLTLQINALNNDISTGNIKTYQAGNTTTFDNITLQHGDYLCFLSTYSYGRVSNKPSMYYISSYYYETAGANQFKLVEGNVSYTLSLSPGVSNTTLSISSTSKSYHRCVLIKLN